jgi:hypothetical protein
MNNFTDKTKLLKYLKTLSEQKTILLVIPAISVGQSGLNDEYKDYLDQSASLYKYLTDDNFNVLIFALGAEHRGDGFLHKIGKDYLMKTYAIPENGFAWNDENFRTVGLCSVEEIQLLKEFLSEDLKDYTIVTCLSQSQLTRYSLHEQGYGINSLYYVFPDKPEYYHSQNQKQEEILVSITKRDPTWETEVGKKLREFAHLMRDPESSGVVQEIAREMQEWLSQK